MSLLQWMEHGHSCPCKLFLFSQADLLKWNRHRWLFQPGGARKGQISWKFDASALQGSGRALDALARTDYFVSQRRGHKTVKSYSLPG